MVDHQFFYRNETCYLFVTFNGVHRSFIVNTMQKMTTSLQPDQGSDHMLPTRDRASRRRQAQGRLRGAPNVGREAGGADRGSTLRVLESTGREGWQTVPGRVQSRTEEGCRGSNGGGVWYRGPQPLYLHDGVYHGERWIWCVSSNAVALADIGDSMISCPDR